LSSSSSLSDIQNMLTAHGSEGIGKWLDICGLFSPASKIDELVNEVKTGGIRSVDELNEYLTSVYNSYDKYAWTWCLNLIGQHTDTIPENISAESLIQIITGWKTNAVKLNNMILKDAEKEFDSGSKIGFGVDGDTDTRESDFQAVRGEYDKNKFVTDLQKESKEIEEKADRLIAIVESFR